MSCETNRNECLLLHTQLAMIMMMKIYGFFFRDILYIISDRFSLGGLALMFFLLDMPLIYVTFLGGLRPASVSLILVCVMPCYMSLMK